MDEKISEKITEILAFVEFLHFPQLFLDSF